MAIVPMKRLSVVAPFDTRDTLLQRLQELGALHLTPLADEVEAPADLLGRLSTVKRLRAALMRFETESAAAAAFDNDAELLEAIERALARRAELESRAAALAKEETAALPWGEATRDDLISLAAAGAEVRAWRIRPDREKEVGGLPAAPGVFLARFADEARGRGLVAVSLPGEGGEQKEALWRAVDSLGEHVEAPARGLAAVRAERAAVDDEVAGVKGELERLAAHAAVFDREEARLVDLLALAAARDGAMNDEHLFAVSGWCPAAQVQAIREAVLEAGGGMLVSDPGPDDEPPVALRNGPLVRLFEPLLNAFQLPNYRESDPTVLFAPFMGLFFGFCLGDAGYGVLLFALATWGRRRLAGRPDGGGEIRKALGLIQILGISTIIIGGLTGNLFGIKLHSIEALGSLTVLSALDEDPSNFFYVALLFGVAQLSFGLLLRLVKNLRRGEFQRALGSLGWLFVLPGIGVWVMKGLAGPFLAALGLILLFNSPSPRMGPRLGGGAWAIYNVTSLLGDVMSYARVFGLGLSSGIIALVVNTIADTVAGSVVGYIAALLILVFGHMFNFVMAVIGSIVHPARLQFLEFFGKFFEGGGESYRPLTRSTKGG